MPGARSGGGSSSVPVSSANSTATYTISPPAGESKLRLTLTAACTLTLGTGGTTGQVTAIQLDIIQDATGSRTITWPGNIDWGTQGAPALSTATGKTDRVYLTTDDAGLSWQGALVAAGYTSPTAPSAPTSLAADGSVSNQATLTWVQGAANGATVTQNKIYRATSSGAETLLTTISAATTYVDTTATNGNTYYYKVSAVNSAGEGTQSSEASAVVGQVTIAADAFTRADGNLIGSTTPTGSKTWANFKGAATWSVASNHVTCSGSPNWAGIDAGVHDCSVQADYDTGASANAGGLICCFVDNNNYITGIVTATNYYIQKVVAGSTTNVNSGGGAQSPGVRTLKMVISGTTFSLYAGGVLKATGTIADAVFTGVTKHGLFSGTSDNTWDNFQATQP